jgi:hypothetical protein
MSVLNPSTKKVGGLFSRHAHSYRTNVSSPMIRCNQKGSSLFTHSTVFKITRVEPMTLVVFTLGLATEWPMPRRCFFPTMVHGYPALELSASDDQSRDVMRPWLGITGHREAVDAPVDAGLDESPQDLL